MTYERFIATREKNYGQKLTPEYKKMQLAAMQIVKSAIDRRKLPALSVKYIQCHDCTRRAQQYDHWDYTKPLEVDPVCRSCNVRRGKTVNAPGHLRTTERKGIVDKQWLASLKVGDMVAVREGFSGGINAVYQISRMTATQIVAGHRKFRRTDGKLVGSSAWNARWIRQPTKEILEEVEERELRESLGSAITCGSLAQLREMNRLWKMK